jgi:aprataxin and PNK-like factor
VLAKDNEVTLDHDCEISLLPNEYIWTIQIEKESDEIPSVEHPATSTFRVRAPVEINENIANDELATGNESPEVDMTEAIRLEEEILRLMSQQQNPVESTSSAPARKRSFEGTEQEPNEDTKRMRTTSNIPKSPEPTPAQNVVIKPDPDSTSACTSSSDNQPTSSNGKAEPVNVKKEPETVRPSCEFGIICYRRDPDHRREYAHPPEIDYRRPEFPPQYTVPNGGKKNIQKTC